MEIVDAKLTLKCEDGTELKADMTDAKVAAIVQSCSYHVVEMDEGKSLLMSFSDKAIEGNILPLLPKIS
jgi:hypothetical protein